MKSEWRERVIKILKGIRVLFNRVLVLLAVIAIGTAMLSAYSFIHFINKMAYIYRGNPNTILIGLVILIIIPLISFLLEKSLSSRLNN
ncbi:hypothetical protein [Candidatus Clostridium radicumherbarum]|uniref:Uncharacterized protein n=1 Tax=Candidatus Clostridium radicumherbarum TaxID=3381662 RepID=A0ABW8TNE3_9CLOT